MSRRTPTRQRAIFGNGRTVLLVTLRGVDNPNMATPSLEQLQEIWAEYDGALLDIFVTDTTLADWQAVVNAVRENDWPTAYTVNGVAAEMPKTVEGIFAARQTSATMWSIKVAADVTINCYFFVVDEIELDFCPREITSDAALAALLDFIAHVGRALNRRVWVAVEGDHHEPRPATGHLYYDPRADAVVAAY